jgi:hypothetical protein
MQGRQVDEIIMAEMLGGSKDNPASEGFCGSSLARRANNAGKMGKPAAAMAQNLPILRGGKIPRFSISALDFAFSTPTLECYHSRGMATFISVRGAFMSHGVLEMDLIEELRLRRWARENYVPPEQRDRTWHPVIHDEMKKKDGEKSSSNQRRNSN